MFKGYLPVLAVVLAASATGSGWDRRGWSGWLRSYRVTQGGVLPLRGRQGRRDRRRRAARALNPWLGAATLATWLIIAFFSAMLLLASLVAARVRAVHQMLDLGLRRHRAVDHRDEPALVWRHSANIGKLLAGTES